MAITVKEIQALAEKAQVFELDPEARYLLVLDSRFVSDDMARKLGWSFGKAGVEHVVVAFVEDPSAIRLFEIPK